MNSKSGTKRLGIPWDDIMEERLAKFPREAVGYLNAALEEGPDVFLVALKHVVNAQKRGVSGVAEATGLHRVSLHKALSRRGNPRLTTLAQILGALRMEFRITPKGKRRRKSA
jgi:probable addiction module antidote protein